MRTYICNKCGKAMDDLDIQERFSFDQYLGYGSKYDMNKLELDLCCACMDQLIDECIVPPVISTAVVGEPIDE